MIRVLSYGGGLDSFAMLLLAIISGVKLDACVFVDVGDSDGLDPGEWPGTYKHIREVVMPLCAAHGIEFIWIDTRAYPVRHERSLFRWLETRGQIPVTGPTRICTIVAKVERFERWMDDRYPCADVEVWIGFEAGEEARAAKDPNAGGKRKPSLAQARRHNRFPLIEAGLCRCRCEEMVRRMGFPVPRKSACMFCPYGSRGDWQTFALEQPRHFARVVKLEADKRPTRRGLKLSIMGFRKRRDGTYVAPPLPVYVRGGYKPKKVPCKVCGAPQRASKATACGYLDEPAQGHPVATAAAV